MASPAQRVDIGKERRLGGVEFLPRGRSPMVETERRQGVSDAARWSSGQDGGLSRRKQEFDSPTGHQLSTGQAVLRYRPKGHERLAFLNLIWYDIF